MIWGTDVLKNRSVTGVATKKKKDAVPKPPLSPHKLSIVRGGSPSGNAVAEMLSFPPSGAYRAHISFNKHPLKPLHARPRAGHGDTST